MRAWGVCGHLELVRVDAVRVFVVRLVRDLQFVGRPFVVPKAGAAARGTEDAVLAKNLPDESIPFCPRE